MQPVKTHLGLIEKLKISTAEDPKEIKPLNIKRLRRVFETAEQQLSKYIPPIFKKNNFFTVKELEMFLELGHSSKDFYNLLEDKVEKEISKSL